eukprot:3868431-Amphidinium_carterae.1
MGGSCEASGHTDTSSGLLEPTPECTRSVMGVAGMPSCSHCTLARHKPWSSSIPSVHLLQGATCKKGKAPES